MLRLSFMSLNYSRILMRRNNHMAGRPKVEGQPRKYMVADDVHEWIVSHGGSQYLNDTIRIIKAVQQ